MLANGVEHPRGSSLEPQHIVLNDLPYALEVDAEVVMHEDIAKRRNPGSFDIWMCRLEAFGETLRAFGDGLQIAEHSVL
jgi:hypothetical protein